MTDRKLRTKWSLECEQDLKNLYGIGSKTGAYVDKMLDPEVFKLKPKKRREEYYKCSYCSSKFYSEKVKDSCPKCGANSLRFVQT